MKRFILFHNKRHPTKMGKEEVEAFLADKSPKAIERAVDRLLDSPHFGGRDGAGTSFTRLVCGIECLLCGRRSGLGIANVDVVLCDGFRLL